AGRFRPRDGRRDRQPGCRSAPAPGHGGAQPELAGGYQLVDGVGPLRQAVPVGDGAPRAVVGGPRHRSGGSPIRVSPGGPSMMNEAALVLTALGSALAAAASSVLQYRSCRRCPHEETHRLLGHVVTQPMWIAGLIAAGVGLVLNAVALANGPLAVVQPLL